MAAGERPALGPESAAEAEHLLALAESELSAGRLSTARRHALRASRLYPSCSRASVTVTAANVLLADASSHHAAILLPDPDDPYASPLSASELRRHFKSLVKSLRVGADYAAAYPASADAAEVALCLATEAYEALTAPPPPGTFWTACAGCSLLLEFERKYLGCCLVCHFCRRTFLAVEVPPPPEAAEPPSRSPSPRRPPPPAVKKLDKLEMTLAEMQLQLAKKRRGAKASDTSSRDSVVVDDDEEEEEDAEEAEAEAENNHSDLMAVEDSHFYNFDADRSERCFKRGQLWALYAADGMPRHYALVDGVQRRTQFRVQIRWLVGEEGKPCGQFRVGSAETVDSVNVFSHLLVCERVARAVYRVYPWKGSVWALHGGEEGNAGWTKYGIVVMLSSYNDQYGASFRYLEKVEGFRSIFTRRDVGSHAVHFLRKGDLGALSHQIPSWKLPKGEGSPLPPGDCWELDPASLPPELLHIEPPNHGNEEEEESAEEAEAENNHSDLMTVEDSDFYNFDADRSERCFKRGQLWALYADADTMPRHYALVDGVQRGTQFRVQILWLEGEGVKPCGQFRVGRAETMDSVNVFSHLVSCERAASDVYRVYPKKASVWALHGGEEGHAARTKYDIVVMLTGYYERCGACFGYLEKVEGFRSIFTRRELGSHAVHVLRPGDLGVLSHQIPARKVSKGEGSALPPRHCWELDPASLPPELLRIKVSNHGNDLVVV